VTSSAQPTQQNPTQTSTAGWGGMQMDQNAWGAPVQATSTLTSTSQPQVNQYHGGGQVQNQSQGDVWGGSNGNGNGNGSAMTADPWASTGGAGSGFGAVAPVAAVKKDDRDPFANIWG
jgi:stromal membrane-associated protein